MQSFIVLASLVSELGGVGVQNDPRPYSSTLQKNTSVL